MEDRVRGQHRRETHGTAQASRHRAWVSAHEPQPIARRGSDDRAVVLTPAALASMVARSAGAVGLAGIGLIHLLDAPGKLSETPYMFWLYLALIVGCVGGAALLLRAPTRWGWYAALVVSVCPFIGYVLSRTTGLPGAMDDIGNWTEPLGLASLYVEAAVVTLSLYGLALLRCAGHDAETAPAAT